MDGFELVVLLSTLVIALLSGILAAFMTYKWKNNRTAKSFAFWAIGLWAFTAAVLLESVFSLNIYSEALIDLYLFLVVFLVEALAMGSLYLLKNNTLKAGYIIYILVIDFAMVLALQFSNTSNLIITYVVYGVLPLAVVVVSSLGTFPAAFILIVVAALSYKRTKNAKMLSIIAGTLVVSIAGSLYIAAFPEFLYYSEFIGILLLWFGFLGFGLGKKAEKVTRHSKKGKAAKIASKTHTSKRKGHRRKRRSKRNR
jgi:hypothetical protein